MEFSGRSEGVRERGFLQFPASPFGNEPGLALSLLSLKINNPIGNSHE